MGQIAARGPGRVKVGRRIADDTGVTDQDDVRCPHCGALLRAGSPWCTLCYTDLRPAPEPVPEPAAVSTREPSYAGAPARVADVADFDPLTAPLSVVEAAGRAGTLDPASAPDATDAGATAVEGEKPAGWPCTHCDEIVSFDEAACPKCGTAFLAGAAGQTDLLDRIGRGGIPASTQAAIIAGGSLGLILLIVGVMYFIGLFL
jgi:hypothetical protein